MKPKCEVQSTHFSGKQFCRHCAIVQPGDIKYEYHLSDDTTHEGDIKYEYHLSDDTMHEGDIKYEYHLSDDTTHEGDIKYEYHLSDDTTHDFVFVKKVLQDIFLEREIKDEAVIIKSDNAPTQYKHKHAFESLQELSGKFNVVILRIYGAAGHGKELIDSMSSFGCKSILRRDIIGKDVWFSSSEVNLRVFFITR